MKIFKLIIILTIYVVLLLSVYSLHISFFNVDVVFYSAILDGVLSALALGCLLLVIPWFRSFNSFEKLQTMMICLCVGYIFAISVPTVIDRSLSFYILEKIQQRGGGIRQDRFADVFTKEYMVEHRLVDVRLTEQQESGTITIQDGCVQLTPRGERLAAFSRFFRQNLLPKQRLLMGEYTDDLTNPFRNSYESFDYECN